MEADITSQAVGLASSADFSLMNLFLRADIVVKSVILILIACSIYSWAVIIEKFRAITGIEKRRYINQNQTVVDISIEAAKKAIKDSGVNQEDIDYIIVAHNVGDITLGSNQVDTLPSLASKVKAKLKIKKFKLSKK